MAASFKTLSCREPVAAPCAPPGTPRFLYLSTPASAPRQYPRHDSISAKAPWAPHPPSCSWHSSLPLRKPLVAHHVSPGAAWPCSPSAGHDWLWIPPSVFAKRAILHPLGSGAFPPIQKEWRASQRPHPPEGGSLFLSLGPKPFATPLLWSLRQGEPPGAWPCPCQGLFPREALGDPCVLGVIKRNQGRPPGVPQRTSLLPVFPTASETHHAVAQMTSEHWTSAGEIWQVPVGPQIADLAKPSAVRTSHAFIGPLPALEKTHCPKAVATLDSHWVRAVAQAHRASELCLQIFK